MRGLIAFSSVIQAAFVVLLVIGVNIAIGGEVDVPELIALLILAVRFVEPLIMSADMSGAVKVAGNALARTDDLLATPVLPDPARSHTPADASVCVGDVSFGYHDDIVIDDVSFTVAAGSMVALVGPSSSGKTTIARLIARFWDSYRGTVEIGGVDMRDMTTADLMSRVSIVFQENYLFAGSIADNVRLARPDANQADLDAVAALVRLDEVVGHGCPTAGTGGRRGRNPPVGRRAPSPWSGRSRRTHRSSCSTRPRPPSTRCAARGPLIVIAHRLSTITAADEIPVLGDDRLAERGAHEDLLRADGRYASFWRQRARAAGWRLAPTEVPPVYEG